MGRVETLYWSENTAPSEVVPLLRNLGEEYSLREGKPGNRGIQLRFERDGEPGSFRVIRRRCEILVEYGALSLAARALSSIWAGIVPVGGSYSEKTPFETLGFMLDCSRNSVWTVAHFKKWLRRCALLGYNQAMLYTEDVYELPGEPYFGYMRGAYTELELREIDRCAKELGIEMVACIQTLGHLQHALKWPAYEGVRDSSGTLLTGIPETYKLIDKMLSYWSGVFQSRRILLGMDEAVDIGKGRGSDRIGRHSPADELFFEHLDIVADLCAGHGLKPLIWSDLVFWAYAPARSLGEAYYKPEARLLKKIRSRLPENVGLVYWDYAPDNPEPYIERIENHRKAGKEPVMASGCQVWGRFWHDSSATTIPRVSACVKACRKAGVKELLMTIWTGRSGADIDSAWSGLAFAAEHAFAETLSRHKLEKRYGAVFRAEYRASVAGALDIWIDGYPRDGIAATRIFEDDPLKGLLMRSINARDGRLLRSIESRYRKQFNELNRWRGRGAAGDMDYARSLADFLSRKVGLSYRLQSAYRTRSRKKLEEVRGEIPELQRSLRAVRKSFRRMWLRQFKPFGMEEVQMKMGGLAARYEELDERIGEFLSGKRGCIEELELPPLPPES